ncbi:hypothetical protein KAM339_023130 [Aeromonas caviae]|nr:hypothetical protein KAM339_023130 [Aeromonas caviae]
MAPEQTGPTGSRLFLSVSGQGDSEQLLVVGIHEELQAVAGFIPVQPQVNGVAASHAGNRRIYWGRVVFLSWLYPLGSTYNSPQYSIGQ